MESGSNRVVESGRGRFRKWAWHRCVESGRGRGVESGRGIGCGKWAWHRVWKVGMDDSESGRGNVVSVWLYYTCYMDLRGMGIPKKSG